MIVSSVTSQLSAGANKTIQASGQKLGTAEDGTAEVMGKSRLPEGMSIISADLIRFSDQVIPAEAG